MEKLAFYVLQILLLLSNIKAENIHVFQPNF